MSFCSRMLNLFLSHIKLSFFERWRQFDSIRTLKTTRAVEAVPHFSFLTRHSSKLLMFPSSINRGSHLLRNTHLRSTSSPLLLFTSSLFSLFLFSSLNILAILLKFSVLFEKFLLYLRRLVQFIPDKSLKTLILHVSGILLLYFQPSFTT